MDAQVATSGVTGGMWARVQVSAYTNGRREVSIEDCLLLQHLMWQTPKEADRIQEWLIAQLAAATELKQCRALLKSDHSLLLGQALHLRTDIIRHDEDWRTAVADILLARSSTHHRHSSCVECSQLQPLHAGITLHPIEFSLL